MARTDLLAIGGSLTVTGGPATVALATSGPLSGNYLLATFASTTATAGSFNVTGLPTGFVLVVNAGNLTLRRTSRSGRATMRRIRRTGTSTRRRTGAAVRR